MSLDQTFKANIDKYDNILAEFVKQVENHGIPFNKKNDSKKQTDAILKKLKTNGAVFRNNGKSVSTGDISTACVACAKSVGSVTTYLSLACNRSCYYCFNPNQQGYKHNRAKVTDYKKEIDKALQEEKELTHIALSGGEPLLFKDETLAFFEYAKTNAPNAHTRLYTAGDLLDKRYLTKLKNIGLQEIRFSIKLEDDKKTRAKILKKIETAKEYIPTVMVEMPVIPGTKDEMQDLIKKLDDIGIYSINLLEFCFPFNNPKDYLMRGFMLKYPPFEVLYNYWYAGGLAVDGSELLSLELLLFAIKENINMHVHYCSLENKQTGQIYRQNKDYKTMPNAMIFSQEDYFLVTTKVFDKDIEKVARLLDRKRLPYEIYDDYGFLQFNPAHISAIKGAGVTMAHSHNVIEMREGDICLRELKLKKI